jgi:hypothetical protein
LTVTFVILRFGPIPTAIVAAPDYEDMNHGFGGSIHENPFALTVMHTIGAVQSSIWFISHLSQVRLTFILYLSLLLHAHPQSVQFVLNHRHQTFAGSYKATAYILLISQILSHLSKILVVWFGKSRLMEPFTIWDLVKLFFMASMGIQAYMLPQVEQV